MPEPKFGYFGNQAPSPSLLLDLWNMERGIIGADIETVSLDDRRPIGLALATTPTDAFFFPTESPVFPWHIIRNPNITKIFHNGHFDLGVFRDFWSTEVVPIKDTIIAAHLLGYPPALASLADTLFGETLISVEDLIGKKGKGQLTMDQIPLEKVAQKGCQDAQTCLKVWHKLSDQVPEKAFDLEMELLPILMEIEARGIRVDITRLQEHKVAVAKDVAFYRGLAKGRGYNPGSSLQVAAVLQGRGHRIYYNRQTRKPIMDEEMLTTEYANDPIAQMTVLYRKSRILLSTFINPVLNRHLVGDRVYGRIHQTVTSTGRLSRTKPNLQNIPPRMRNIFIPSEGCTFEDWDLNQIELRWLAYQVWQYTGDRTMMSIFERGGNIHGEAARLVGTTYSIGKQINFSITFGGDEWTLYRKSGVPLEVGRGYIQQYFQQFPGVKVYIKLIHDGLARDGFVTTPLGRKRYLPDIGSPYQWKREKAEREGFNTTIQGAAAETLKELQVRTGEEPQCNSIHDEVIFDIPHGYKLDRSINQGLAPFPTPMSVKQGRNWRDLVEIGVI